ncbi:MAG TPA: hypothetical protein VNO43_06780 [Candidatus Eisenbacteria bacterium]|nr:hypothetical protein [Candidatus Eisenbacteria bacterium]
MSEPQMGLDAPALYAALAEKEKVKGHHSPEGRAIRVMTRALDGWSAGSVSAADVVILCDQAVEDWLKARLQVPLWLERNLPALLPTALEKNLISGDEAEGLRTIHDLRSRLRAALGHACAEDAERTLELCIRIVERCW